MKVNRKVNVSEFSTILTICPSISAGRIYWADFNNRRIESSTTDGTDRKVLFTSNTNHYFGVALGKDHIYFTVHNSG